MRLLLVAVLPVLLALPSCLAPGPPPPPDLTPPARATFHQMAERISAVVITDTDDISRWLKSRLAVRNAPTDADGGSATPITPDGYFMTASHVIANANERNVYVIYGRGERFDGARARIIWQSAAADLALLHAPVSTQRYYEWTPEDKWLPAGTPVAHAGIATGNNMRSGKLKTAIPPATPFSQFRSFEHDMPLSPGDSGGAVVDAHGRLVGVNSAVEFLVPLETAFFIKSEGNRPNVAFIQRLIEKDRNRRPGTDVN